MFLWRSRPTVQNGCRAPSVDPSLGTAGTSCRLIRCLLEALPDRRYTSYTNFITPCGHTSVVLFPQTKMLERIISLIIIIQETVFSGAGAPALHFTLYFFILSRPWPKIKFPSDFSLFWSWLCYLHIHIHDLGILAYTCDGFCFCFFPSSSDNARC